MDDDYFFWEKRLAQQEKPLTLEEGLRLFDRPLPWLAAWALEKKEERFGKKITYISNYYINITNICQHACRYCGFRRHHRAADAYTLTLEEVEKKLTAAPEDLSEIWLSSGLNPKIPLDYYKNLIKIIKKIKPQACLKAFTAVEIDFFSKIFQQSHESILDGFFEVGLDRIPGGGAEIFNPEIRKLIDIKTHPEDYLKIHGICHRRGVPTSVTMMYGHVEKRIHRIEHMIKVREFQEKSRGFQAFIPLNFHDQNNPLGLSGVLAPHPVEILKTLAISRLMLSNVDHIQGFWVYIGESLAQVALHMGIDDLNGTLVEENIVHSSGAKTQTYTPSRELQSWIERADLIPVERDAWFSPKTKK